MGDRELQRPEGSRTDGDPVTRADTGTVAVSGASGYVGSRLGDYLSRQGWAVRGLVRAKAGAGPSNGRTIPFSLEEGVDPERLRGTDVLVHCAYDFRAATWEEICRANVEGSFRLFDAATKAGIGRIIFISTMSAFEGCASMYGKAKLEIERAAREMGAVIVRPGLVYGRGAEGMVGALDRFVRVSVVAPVFGGGAQMLYLAHQEDLANLVHVLCSLDEVPREPVIAACDRGMTFREILAVLARARGKRLLFIPAPWRAAWLALRAAEALGVRIRLRSDSLVSLLNQNQNPDFGPTRRVGVEFRDFKDWTGI